MTCEHTEGRSTGKLLWFRERSRERESGGWGAVEEGGGGGGGGHLGVCLA